MDVEETPSSAHLCLKGSNRSDQQLAGGSWFIGTSCTNTGMKASRNDLLQVTNNSIDLTKALEVKAVINLFLIELCRVP